MAMAMMVKSKEVPSADLVSEEPEDSEDAGNAQHRAQAISSSHGKITLGKEGKQGDNKMSLRMRNNERKVRDKRGYAEIKVSSTHFSDGENHGRARRLIPTGYRAYRTRTSACTRTEA